MDHVDLVLHGNLDDLVAGEVGADGCVLAALADLVGLVCLLTVHAEAVLVAVDGDRVQRQLVGCAEDADGDLASVGDHELLELHDGAVGSQPVVHRVAVRVVLAMLVVKGRVVNGRRRRRVLVNGQRGHDGGRADVEGWRMEGRSRGMAQEGRAAGQWAMGELDGRWERRWRGGGGGEESVWVGGERGIG